MTSLLIDAFKRREEEAAALAPKPSSTDSLSPKSDESCTFCAIVAGRLPAFKVYEDEHAVAFLDILPIRRGHTLLIPKSHHTRVTSLPGATSAEVARSLPRLCRAICKATRQPDFNVISNNGYAQVVDHVHWHIVPAPEFGDRRRNVPVSAQHQPSPTPGLLEIANRHELEDDDGEALSESIREAITAEEERELQSSKAEAKAKL